MSWFNKFFKKDEPKTPCVKSMEARIKALNEKTQQKIKDEEVQKAFAGRIAALSKKDSINAQREEYNAIQRNRFNATRDDDSDDGRLPSIGGSEDDYDRPKYGYNGYPPRNDRFSPMGGNGSSNRRSYDQSGQNGSSAGGQQNGSNPGGNRNYNPLFFIDLPIPRK
uniref:Uncharacterized protein n=1 Tax=Panagrolaimus sp. PS1159 TaxID=55785 RepID=A0AC35F9I4_9BILA